MHSYDYNAEEEEVKDTLKFLCEELYLTVTKPLQSDLESGAYICEIKDENLVGSEELSEVVDEYCLEIECLFTDILDEETGLLTGYKLAMFV